MYFSSSKFVVKALNDVVVVSVAAWLVSLPGINDQQQQSCFDNYYKWVHFAFF